MRSSGSLVEGEFPLTQSDFGRIAGMLRADSGISLPDSKATLVYSRLGKRLRALGLESFDAYCVLLAEPEGREERKAMLAALTTNVTRFYREPHHFEHLAKSVLPPLIEQAKRGGRLRIWSSACSNGQEPYTIAMTLLGLLPDATQYDIRILATDIDPNMLADGRAGLYDTATLALVPAPLRQRWFKPAPESPGSYRAGEALRTLVKFLPLNLIGDWPIRGTFQAIFCRNVMIYFDADTQSAVWARMIERLAPDGALYIGHSERVAGPAAAYLRSDGMTTYRRMTGVAA